MSIFGVSEDRIRSLARMEAHREMDSHTSIYHTMPSHNYMADWERIKIQQRIAALEMRLGWLSDPKHSPLRAEDV